MKNTFGQSVCVTVFGESHGEAIGAVIDGLAPGISVNYDFIASQLSKRRPSSQAETLRVERDEYKIISGVFEGKTTGTPIAIIIPNENTRSKDYSKMSSVARPSHADYSAECKYHGYQDYRGGGHFSGRITASLVAAGAIAISALESLGIYVGTHILSCYDVCDREFSDTYRDILSLRGKSFPTLSDCQSEMNERIMAAKKEGDSVGGVLQCAIYGLPAGLGEPWFDSCESIISHAMFSIGGVKGIEFGRGFALSKMKGSEANDPFTVKDGSIITETNNNGGINGGITNGMPVVFNLAVKPTPSISKEQRSVDFRAMENKSLVIEGRHDPAIIRRACVVVDSVCALAVCDMLAQRYGTDVFTKGLEK